MGSADRRDGRGRALTVVSLAVIALAAVAGAFFVGTMMSPAKAESRALPARAASAVPTASASPTASGPASGPASGAVAWNALEGGECLDDYRGPWRTTFEVVDCDGKHEAQVTRRIALKGDTHPGYDELIGRLSATCASPKTVRLDAAARYRDIRVAFSYPTPAQWASGERAAYCFVDRTGDDTIEGSLAAD